MLARSAFLRGMLHGAPFVVVIVPFALLFGLLASDAGLAPWEVLGFSLSVFAGASQFAALQLLQDKAPVLVILVTALAVNLRMVMYSVALAPHFGTAPLRIRAVMAYFLVDQSFALSVAEFERRKLLSMAEKVAYFFGTVMAIAPLWMVSAVAGGGCTSKSTPAVPLRVACSCMSPPLLRLSPAVNSGVRAPLPSGIVTLAMRRLSLRPNRSRSRLAERL